MRGNWAETELAALCKTSSGGTPKRGTKAYYNGTIPWVKSGELRSNTVFDTEEKITQAALDNSSAKIIEKGALLIAMYGATIGKLAFLGVDAATNQAVCSIRPSKSLNPKYLYHLLELRKRKLISKGAGGAQPNISQTIIKQIKIPLPPLPEQRAIVAKLEQLFSELDSGVVNLKCAQEKLKIYRQAVLKKAFEGELTKEQAMIQWSELGNYIDKPRYGTSKKCISEVLSRAVLRIPNIGDGILKHGDLKYADFDDSESEKLALKEGDVLVIRSNGSIDLVGKCALIQKSDIDYLYAGYLIRIRPNNDELNSRYLIYVLQSHALRVQIESTAKSTSGVNNINSGELCALQIPICTPKEQHQIVQEIESRLSVCDKLEESITTNLQKAEALRQSILKKAFEGRLLTEAELEACRKEEDWCPAEELLERIKKPEQ